HETCHLKPPLVSRDRQCNEFPRILAARHGNQYVLFSVEHISHWRVADASRELDLPDDLSGFLVEGAEHLSAESCRHADTAVAAFTHEHKCLRHDRGVASGCANVGQIQTLECRMVFEARSVGD